jgi:hypothetical protein
LVWSYGRYTCPAAPFGDGVDDSSSSGAVLRGEKTPDDALAPELGAVGLL